MKALVTRYFVGITIMAVAFFVAPTMPSWQWPTALFTFLLGNVIRPRYREKVLKRDATYNTVMEIISFLLVVSVISAVGFALGHFRWREVSEALLGWPVLISGYLFFALLALRDLLRSIRQYRLQK